MARIALVTGGMGGLGEAFRDGIDAPMSSNFRGIYGNFGPGCGALIPAMQLDAEVSISGTSVKRRSCGVKINFAMLES